MNEKKHIEVLLCNGGSTSLNIPFRSSDNDINISITFNSNKSKLTDSSLERNIEPRENLIDSQTKLDNLDANKSETHSIENNEDHFKPLPVNQTVVYFFKDDYQLYLDFNEVSVENQGIYKLAIQNQYGTTICFVELIVLHKPDAPINLELKYTPYKISSRSTPDYQCFELSWQEPTTDHNIDTGPILRYMVERQDALVQNKALFDRRSSCYSDLPFRNNDFNDNIINNYRRSHSFLRKSSISESFKNGEENKTIPTFTSNIVKNENYFAGIVPEIDDSNSVQLKKTDDDTWLFYCSCKHTSVFLPKDIFMRSTKFRVAAENNCGIGNFSDPIRNEQLKVDGKAFKPWFVRKLPDKLEVSNGQCFSFFCNNQMKVGSKPCFIKSLPEKYYIEKGGNISVKCYSNSMSNQSNLSESETCASRTGTPPTSSTDQITLPSSPQNLTVVHKDESNFYIYWKPPLNIGCCPLTKYILEIMKIDLNTYSEELYKILNATNDWKNGNSNKDNVFTNAKELTKVIGINMNEEQNNNVENTFSGMECWQELTSLKPDVLECLIEGLQKDDFYRFRIIAENKFGRGSSLELKKLLTCHDNSKIPMKPQNLKIIEKNDDKSARTIHFLTWEHLSPIKKTQIPSASKNRNTKLAIEDEESEESTNGDNLLERTHYIVEIREISGLHKIKTSKIATNKLSVNLGCLNSIKTYEYKVCANNIYGSSDFSDVTFSLNNLDRKDASFKALQFIEKMKDVSLNIGEKAIVNCIVSGFPEPSIKWFKNQCKVFDGYKHIISQHTAPRGENLEGNVFQYGLIIRDVSLEDSGEIECRVYNGINTISCKSLINLNCRSNLTVINIKEKISENLQLYKESNEEFDSTRKLKIIPSSQSNIIKNNEMPLDSYNVAQSGINKSERDKYDTLCEVSEARTKLPTIRIDVNMLKGEVEMNKKYVICEEISRGKYCSMHRLLSKSQIDQHYLGRFTMCSTVEKTMLRQEAGILNQLNHANIIKLIEAFETDGEMAFVLELISGEDLLSKMTTNPFDTHSLRENNRSINIRNQHPHTEFQCIQYIKQICQALVYLQASNVVNLDLRLETIFFSTSKSNRIKLTSFGMAQQIDPDRIVSFQFSKIDHCAPELLNYAPVSCSADMWSLGVLTYTILSGISPFAGNSTEEIFSRLNNENVQLLFDLQHSSNNRQVNNHQKRHQPSYNAWDHVSNYAKNWISMLLQRKPTKRMSASKALTHAWLNGEAELKLSRSQQLDTEQLIKLKNSLFKNSKESKLPIGRYSWESPVFLKLSQKGIVMERELKFELPNQAPQVLSEVNNTETYEGTIAMFKCKFNGLPKPDIKWMFEEHLLRESASGKYTIYEYNGITTLTISNVNQDDSGLYTCYATNNLGSCTTAGELNVQELAWKKGRVVERYE